MTEATQTPAIQANFNNRVDEAEFKFSFKKDDLGNKRPTVELKLPVPSIEGIIAILENGEKDESGKKQLALLREAMYDVIRAAAAQVVSEKEDVSQSNFPVEKVLWETIANTPKQDRRTIDPAIWTAFAKEYVEIMPAITGKDIEAVTNATQVYMKKFAQVKTNKPVLTKLQGQLALFAENTKNGEQFTELLEMLTGKIDMYLKSNDVELLVANL